MEQQPERNSRRVAHPNAKHLMRDALDALADRLPGWEVERVDHAPSGYVPPSSIHPIAASLPAEVVAEAGGHDRLVMMFADTAAACAVGDRGHVQIGSHGVSVLQEDGRPDMVEVSAMLMVTPG